MVRSNHLKGLKSFAEEYKVKKLIVVSTDVYPRKSGNFSILPWRVFLERLWAGEIIRRYSSRFAASDLGPGSKKMFPVPGSWFPGSFYQGPGGAGKEI